MSRIPSLVLSLALLSSLGATACAIAPEETGKDDRAVSAGERPTCDVAATPIPGGWAVHALARFSVARPAEGFVASESSPAMVQFFATRAPDTSLGAYVRSDVTLLDDAVATWKTALTGKCEATVEDATYLCDPAKRVHCVSPRGRNVEVMIVLHRGATYAVSCELDEGDAALCSAFFQTLRTE